MSTDRIKGEIVFICDDCDEHLETGEADFEAARQFMRGEGWRAVQPTPGVWENRCPRCRGGSRQSDFRSQRRPLK